MWTLCEGGGSMIHIPWSISVGFAGYEYGPYGVYVLSITAVGFTYI